MYINHLAQCSADKSQSRKKKIMMFTVIIPQVCFLLKMELDLLCFVYVVEKTSENREEHAQRDSADCVQTI